MTRELFIVRVDKEHTADDIKEFIQEQEVTAIDISCVSHADSYTNSYDVVAQANNVDNISMPDSWPEGICCRRVYRKRKEQHTNGNAGNEWRLTHLHIQLRRDYK